MYANDLGVLKTINLQPHNLLGVPKTTVSATVGEVPATALIRLKICLKAVLKSTFD